MSDEYVHIWATRYNYGDKQLFDAILANPNHAGYFNTNSFHRFLMHHNATSMQLPIRSSFMYFIKKELSIATFNDRPSVCSWLLEIFFSYITAFL